MEVNQILPQIRQNQFIQATQIENEDITSAQCTIQSTYDTLFGELKPTVPLQAIGVFETVSGNFTSIAIETDLERNKFISQWKVLLPTGCDWRCSCSNGNICKYLYILLRHKMAESVEVSGDFACCYIAIFLLLSGHLKGTVMEAQCRNSYFAARSLRIIHCWWKALNVWVWIKGTSSHLSMHWAFYLGHWTNCNW